MGKRLIAPPDLPLLAWGDARQIARRRRQRLALRAGALAIGIGALALTIVEKPTPRLVWNASASAPLGLYSVSPDARIARGDMVIARVPSEYRKLADRRRYLPANVPLVKRVTASTGDRVCARRATIFINGNAVATRRVRDRSGRPMPHWTGCVRLGDDQLFLLMTDSPGSFDGRYFGITAARDVIGKATLVWAKPSPAPCHG